MFFTSTPQPKIFKYKHQDGTFRKLFAKLKDLYS